MTDKENIIFLEETIGYNNRVGRPTAVMNVNYLDELLDLINRLQAKNEGLKEKSIADDKLLNDRVQEAITTVSKANQKYVDALERAFNDKVAELKTVKAEAYKECIAKVKENSANTGLRVHMGHCERLYTIAEGELDDLLKEMVGDK